MSVICYSEEFDSNCHQIFKLLQENSRSPRLEEILNEMGFGSEEAEKLRLSYSERLLRNLWPYSWQDVSHLLRLAERERILEKEDAAWKAILEKNFDPAQQLNLGYIQYSAERLIREGYNEIFYLFLEKEQRPLYLFHPNRFFEVAIICDNLTVFKFLWEKYPCNKSTQERYLINSAENLAVQIFSYLTSKIQITHRLCYSLICSCIHGYIYSVEAYWVTPRGRCGEHHPRTKEALIQEKSFKLEAVLAKIAELKVYTPNRLNKLRIWREKVSREIIANRNAEIEWQTSPY